MTIVVGLPCCLQTTSEQAFHSVYDKYVKAVQNGAGALSILIPAIGAPPLGLLDRIDGLLLPGSPSNIEPHHYDGPAPPDGNQVDPARDATILPLIRAAAAMGMPVFGICRGLQELNVALGGTLHQEVHEVDGRMDHREPPGGPVDHRYRPVHPVHLTEAGLFAGLAGSRVLTVNSLHGQGIDRPAAGLLTEAVAPDGQIEAVRLDGADFVVAVQWHPEWNFCADPFSRVLFSAFGDACRRFAAHRNPIEVEAHAIRAA